MKGHHSFRAGRAGWCRGCHTRVTVGSNVWSPGKGGGVYHVGCQPPITVRSMTEEDRLHLEQARGRKAMGSVE